jgi:hypothetical protein
MAAFGPPAAGATGNIDSRQDALFGGGQPLADKRSHLPAPLRVPPMMAGTIAVAVGGQDLTGIIAALAAIGGAAIIVLMAMRWSRPRHGHDQGPRRKRGMPAVARSTRRGGSSAEFRPVENGRSPSGSLRVKGGGNDGAEWALGREPAILGSANECTIVLAGDGIAPEHARIWVRQGKYLLHHVGGLSRKTFVSGQEADWVVLEPGDEVVIGAHRLVFEDKRAAEAEVAVAAEPTPKEESFEDDLARMEAAVRALWAEAVPASETAVGERAGTGKYKVHRRKDELAGRVGGQWVKRGRTVVLER